MIEILSGTNRPGSNALRISTVIEGLYRELGAEVRILDLADMPPEIFQPTAYAEKPATFKPLCDRVLKADGLHVVTPEYNGSFPGVLKYFIDMLKFPESFEHRCVAFTGEAAGLWGGIRSVEQLEMVFNYRNAYMLPERTFITQVHNKLNDAGELTDEFQLGLLKKQCAEFVSFVNRNSGMAARESG